MPERYVKAIMKYLADRDYRPLKPRQLARIMGVQEEDYGTFRDAVKQLRDAGRIVLGSHNAVMLPPIPETLTGYYRPNPRGFGFIVPESPNAHGDLFIPPGAQKDALAGDLVRARVKKRGKRGGETVYAGEIVAVVQRGENRFVGTLNRAEKHWFVLPDGTQMTSPIVVRDVGTTRPGEKVVVEITQYPKPGDLPAGVIVETLGRGGQLEVETLGVIRAHGLRDEFPAEALDEARNAVQTFDVEASGAREDLTDVTIATIDPPDARDYDDAISLVRDGDMWTLGVHIADVSHFVPAGGPLDVEARRRGTSTYFPRRVLPMLPEILSNGVCSLQEGVKRFCKSVFIHYDEQGRIQGTRFAETVIRSSKRLTYLEAQGILDGQTGGFDRKVVALVKNMQTLARKIEARRRGAGMLHLDLPEVELVLNDAGQVEDAQPTDDSYTHTIIEMFMVEANDAVAGLFDRLERPILRRIHPSPDPAGAQQLTGFVQAAGHRLPKDMSRKDMQNLLEKVKGQPESYAVNLALLKTFQQAEYSPMRIGHWALASEHYCHFTSPIRRYPDLTVHRMFAEHCRGQLRSRPPEDLGELTKLGEACTACEKRSEAAEDELREVLVLQLLATRVGETFRGVITGVTGFGVFVQSQKYLVEGLIRLEDFGDDWWEVSARNGQVRGERTGKTYRIGDLLEVRIANVDVARRQLSLAPERQLGKRGRKSGKSQGKPKGGKSKSKGKGGPKGPKAGPGKAKNASTKAKGGPKGSRTGKRAKGKRSTPGRSHRKKRG
jgi:ribonuclease R